MVRTRKQYPEFELDVPPDGTTDADARPPGEIVRDVVSGLIVQRAELDGTLLRERRAASRRQQSLFLKLIGVVDAFDHVLGMTDLTTLDEVGRQYVQTLESLRVLLEDALAEHDVVALEGLEGHPYNPAQQQALPPVIRDDCDANTVLEVVERGYIWGEIVLRRARVVVSQKSNQGG